MAALWPGYGKPPEDEPVLPLEHERRISWRHDQLERMGFAGAVLEVLTTAFDIDLHDAQTLIDGGCPPGLAARILL